MWYKASAPGSLMLLGEYAVLNGHHALVCAIDKRITVYLSPRDDEKITIQSVLGDFLGTLSAITSKPPFQFVLTAIMHFHGLFKTGFDLKIESEFSSEIGFGSSAAVTVATLAVLAQWLHQTINPEQLIQQARAVIQSVQGVGSGADVAACVLGGIVGYRMEPFWVESFPSYYPITVVFSGYKTPTREAIAHVRQIFSTQPEKLQEIYENINQCAMAGIGYMREQKWTELGKIFNDQQKYMHELGVNTPELENIIETLQSHLLGAKISGSGLGDCAVALGEPDYPIVFNNPLIKIVKTSISTRGVECEKN